MSSSDTEDDELSMPPAWLNTALNRCPGLVSEAALAKRKREQEAADRALAQRLQREEDEAEERQREEEAARRRADAAQAAEMQRMRATARHVRDSPRRPEVISLSDCSSSDSEIVAPRRPAAARGRARRALASPDRTPLSPLSPPNSASPRRRSELVKDEGDKLLGGPRDHQQPPGPLPPQPTALRVPSLYPYQKAALAWMLQQERGAGGPVRGGLLADEQGMGKTVQTIALCLAHPPSLAAAPVGGCLSSAGGGSRAALGTLIVCPLNLLRQWERELKAKAAPPYGGNVCVHHGAGRARAAAPLAAYDFVLTTYAVVRSELGGARKQGARAHGGGAAGGSSAADGAQGAAEVAAAPGQGALFGLRWWRIVLDEAHQIRNGAAGISQACCALPATHRWALSGTPLQNSALDLYPLLRYLRYPRYGESAAAFKPLAKRGGAEDLHGVLAAVMLRRLKSDRFEGEPILALPPKRTSVVQRAFGEAEAKVYQALERSARLEFNRIRDDGAVQARYLHVLALLTRLRQACDSPLLVREQYEHAEAAAAEAAAAEAAAGPPPTAPALRRAAAMMAEGAAAEDCPICMDTLQRDGGAITACGHPFCAECIAEHIARAPADDDGGARCPLCRAALCPADVFSWRRLPPHPPAPPPPPPDAAAEGAGGAGGAGGGAPSSKMAMVLHAVREVRARGDDEKLLVFSCYTKFLDLLQGALGAAGFACCRVDGSQTADARDAQVARFHGAGVPVMLISLKCGVGLNLTCASTVVLCEPWNPFAEEQACDRVHRIGQQREVRVLRLAVPGTVEDRILQLQEKKRAVAAHILQDARPGDDAAGRRNAARLSESDLAQLFGV